MLLIFMKKIRYPGNCVPFASLPLFDCLFSQLYAVHRLANAAYDARQYSFTR
jgi:hypothetical protein